MSTGDSHAKVSPSLCECTDATLDAVGAILTKMPRQEAQRLVYNRQLGRIELQMQHVKLRYTVFDLQPTADLFTNIYDCAPAEYRTLPPDLTTHKANRSASALFVYGLKRRFFCPQPIKIATPQLATHLFRIAQAAINKASTHSKCIRIRIPLWLANARIALGIRDDGHGPIPQGKTHRGIGLHVLLFRAAAIEGSPVVQRPPKGGTELLYKLAIPPPPHPR